MVLVQTTLGREVFFLNSHFKRAHNVATLLAQEFPDKFETWSFGPSRDEVG